MATPVGPLFAAGSTEITKSGYKISFLPDAHNGELQRAGQPPIYYWLPNEVRLAQKASGVGRLLARPLRPQPGSVGKRRSHAENRPMGSEPTESRA
jgi:hypothetical protein